MPAPRWGDTAAALPVGGGSGSGAGGSGAGAGGAVAAGMALDVRRLEALSLQELSALLDDEEQLQDMARQMEEVRGARAAPCPGRSLPSGRRPPHLSPPGRCPRGLGARCAAASVTTSYLGEGGM